MTHQEIEIHNSADAMYIADQMIQKYGLDQSLSAATFKASRPDFSADARAYWGRIAGVLAKKLEVGGRK